MTCRAMQSTAPLPKQPWTALAACQDACHSDAPAHQALAQRIPATALAACQEHAVQTTTEQVPKPRPALTR